MWYVRSLSIAAYQLVTSTIMSRQRERQRHPSRRPRLNNANPSVHGGRSIPTGAPTEPPSPGRCLSVSPSHWAEPRSLVAHTAGQTHTRGTVGNMRLLGGCAHVVDDDPEHSSGPDRDLETTSSSNSVVVQGLPGLNEHS